MTEFDIEKIDRIVSDLLLEFKEERNKLQYELDNANSKIMEIDRSISSFKENEDVDIKVFSPRNLSNLNLEKIEMMNQEKAKIEDSSKSVIKQLNYYSDKCDKLGEIKNIIQGSSSSSTKDKIDGIMKMFSIDSENSNQIEQNSNDVFSTNISLDYNNNQIENNENNNDIFKGTSDRVENNEKISVSDGISVVLENSNSVIEKASIVINNPDDNFSKYDKLSLIKEMEILSHRLEITIKIIDNDVYRTKMDLKSIKNSLDDLLTSLRNSI